MPLVIQSATPEGVRLYAHEPPLETSPDLPIVTAVLSIFIWKNIDRMMPASIRHSILHIFFCALHVDTLVICFEKLPFMISFQILVIFLTELFTLCNLFRSASRARPVADSSAAFRIILDQHGRRWYILDPRHLQPATYLQILPTSNVAWLYVKDPFLPHQPLPPRDVTTPPEGAKFYVIEAIKAMLLV
jgi:hypothetical protein